MRGVFDWDALRILELDARGKFRLGLGAMADSNTFLILPTLPLLVRCDAAAALFAALAWALVGGGLGVARGAARAPALKPGRPSNASALSVAARDDMPSP